MTGFHQPRYRIQKNWSEETRIHNQISTVYISYIIQELKYDNDEAIIRVWTINYAVKELKVSNINNPKAEFSEDAAQTEL